MSLTLPKGVIADQVNPQPSFWPQCDTCHVPYILRRALSFGSGGYKWAWMRDCDKPRSTCKNAKAVIAGPDGVVTEDAS